MSERDNLSPPDVHQLNLRERTSDFAEEARRGSDTSSVQNLEESLTKRSTMLRGVRAKEKVKRFSGPKNLPWEVSGRAQRRDRMWRAAASRGHRTKKKEGALKNPREKTGAKEGVEGKPHGREKASRASCAERLGTPRGCAPEKDGFSTGTRTRPKEKTPKKLGSDSC